MASVGKEITSEKFEEYLVEFSEENKVNIDIPAVMRRLKSARNELQDDMEAYQSFYNDFKLYMEKDINAIDSSGNINPTILSVFTKSKKEAIQNRKQIEKNNQSYNENVEIQEAMPLEKMQERLEQIDFTQMTMDDFAFILEHYEELKEKLTVEAKQNVNNIISNINILNTDEFLQTLKKFTIEIQDGEELSKEQIQTLLDLEKKYPGSFERHGIDLENINESFAKQRLTCDEIGQLEMTVLSLLMRYPGDEKIAKEYIKNVVLENPTVKAGLEKYPNIINTDILLNNDLSKKDLEDLFNKAQGIEHTGKPVANVFNGSRIINETFEARFTSELEQNETRILDSNRVNALETAIIIKNIGMQYEVEEDVTPVSDFSSINFSSSFDKSIFQYEKSLEEQLPKEKDVLTKMQQENEQYMAVEMARAVDFADVMKTAQNIFEKSVAEVVLETFEQEKPEEQVREEEALNLDEESSEAFKQEEVEQTEPEIEELQAETEFEQEVQEEVELEDTVQEKLEEEYQSETFELEEKTGIAGLFAAIANSRVGRAVQNLFKTKDAQKRLNAPTTQRTEDGLKITEYESNGSLMPTTMQARNFLRDFAVNTVEAVTNFANNISDAFRGNKEDEVINKPTIIKSEPVQEQTKEVEQQPVVEEVQEKAETYMDNNQWAVSSEELQKQAKLNDTQAKKVQTPEQNRDNIDNNEGR